MEENYVPQPHINRPGALSVSANSPASVNAPGTARESRGTNGIDVANTSIPLGPEYGGEEHVQRPASSLFITVTFVLAMV